MNTQSGLQPKTAIEPCGQRQVVRQLRLAAAKQRESEARRQWIRAATRC
ncbi:MAG TPA: hypothetical protein VFR27_07810 [Mycobacterium sp.]|nr:hypothetical protein [Mycobacterium sp.]